MQPAYMQHSLVLNAFLLCIHAGCILHFLLWKNQNAFRHQL